MSPARKTGPFPPRSYRRRRNRSWKRTFWQMNKPFISRAPSSVNNFCSRFLGSSFWLPSPVRAASLDRGMGDRSKLEYTFNYNYSLRNEACNGFPGSLSSFCGGALPFPLLTLSNSANTCSPHPHSQSRVSDTEISQTSKGKKGNVSESPNSWSKFLRAVLIFQKLELIIKVLLLLQVLSQ